MKVCEFCKRDIFPYHKTKNASDIRAGYFGSGVGYASGSSENNDYHLGCWNEYKKYIKVPTIVFWIILIISTFLFSITASLIAINIWIFTPIAIVSFLFLISSFISLFVVQKNGKNYVKKNDFSLLEIDEITKYEFEKNREKIKKEMNSSL